MNRNSDCNVLRKELLFAMARTQNAASFCGGTLECVGWVQVPKTYLRDSADEGADLAAGS